MDNLTLPNLDTYYAVGLCGVFVGIYLAVYALNYFVVEPLSRRRQLRQRLKEDKRQLEMAQIFKAENESRQSLVLTLVSKSDGMG